MLAQRLEQRADATLQPHDDGHELLVEAVQVGECERRRPEEAAALARPFDRAHHGVDAADAAEHGAVEEEVEVEAEVLEVEEKGEGGGGFSGGGGGGSGGGYCAGAGAAARACAPAEHGAGRVGLREE